MSKEAEEKPGYIGLISKCAVPVIVAIITLIGYFGAAHIQSRMSATTLISQREQAESELRATMFKDLIGPIIGTKDQGKMDPKREGLLVGLLALNFGEHFEFKPLLIEVDEKLSDEIESNEIESKCSSLFCMSEIKDPASLAIKLRDAKDPISKYIQENFLPETKKMLMKYDGFKLPPDKLLNALLIELNRILTEPGLFDKDRFANVELPEQIRTLTEECPHGKALIRLNRFLLGEAYPQEITKSPIKEPLKARESLRSIARRVISRQLAMLSNEGPKGDKTKVEILTFFSPEEYLERTRLINFSFSKGEFKYPFTIEGLCKAIKDDGYKLSLKASENTIDWLNELLERPNFYDEVHEKHPYFEFSEAIKSLVEKTKNYRDKDFSSIEKEQQDNVKKLNRLILMKNFPKETPGYIIDKEKEILLKSPGKSCDLYIRIESCDWYNQTCKIRFWYRIKSQDMPSEVSQPFRLTWFDFPLTDNTLLADGNRFAVVFDQFHVDKKLVALKLVWFPKVYFTPRERPINYSEFRKKLGIEVGK